MTEFAQLLVLLLLSGVFSGSETALVALSMARVDALVREGRSGAVALYRLKKDPSRMLTTILIGNNLVNIAASAMATVMATRMFGSAGPGIAVGVLTLVILIFGEITPKSLATRYSERISLFIALPMLGFMRLIYPFVWLFGHLTTWVYHLTGGQGDPTVTESEVISMLDYGEQEGTIEPDERKIIERVFAFNDLCVRDVMTPQGRIFSVDGSLTVEDALPKVTGGTFSRIPLYHEHPEELKKVLYLRDLLEAVAAGSKQTRLDDIAHELLYAPQQQTIAELFRQLRKTNRHIAGVVDEYGTVRGVVTMEDLMEELVGEIYDETDVAPEELVRISEHEISVEGVAELRLIEKFFAIELPGKPTDTVGFWLLSHLEYIPKEQEIFTIDGLEVTIVKASTRSIERVVIRKPVELPD
ncbi:MAG: hemolysin family protein [Gammaproteobacteria bacterium]|nr:hemolysin family protein [Gammaproteobacteria bacterium]